MRAIPLALTVLLAASPALRAETLSAAPGGFTEDQARERIQFEGYTHVAELRLDARGLWHGLALRNGDERQLSLSARGEVEDALELAALTMFDRETGDIRTVEAPAANLVLQVAH